MTEKQFIEQHGENPMVLLEMLEDIDSASLFFLEHGLVVSIDLLQSMKLYFIGLDTVNGYLDAGYMYDLQNELHERLNEMILEI